MEFNFAHTNSTAIIPERKIPSKVPAPPILTIGASSRLIFDRFNKSAPINVPRVPAQYAVIEAIPGERTSARTAAVTGGINAGIAIPIPRTGRAMR